MVINMAIILDQVKLESKYEGMITSEAARRYIKMIMLEQELEKEKQELTLKLQKEELQSISNYFNVPKFLSVREVANLTGLSQQIVRRHCANGKYSGYQTSGQNGTWHVESDQFSTLPNFMDFISKRNEGFTITTQIAKQLLNEDD